MNKIGRNDPCPCGSGKKYKKCCLSADVEQRAQSNPAAEVNQILSEAFAGQQLETLEDAQVFAEHKIRQMNEAPRDKLGGFSPNQLHTLLNYPLEEQQLIGWQPTISNQALEAAPVWVVFNALRTYLSEHSAKATAKGNLPRALVKFVEFRLLEKYDGEFRLEKINKEEDFRELNITRLVLELAGLIRLYKGHFTLTKKALSLPDSELFKLLLTTYKEKYNWGYEDLYPELDFIQSAGWYSLVALHRLNGKRIYKLEFAENFVRVFPMLLEEVEGDTYRSPLDCIINSYSIRTIERFWEFFGFVTLEGEIFTQDYRKTMVTMPLLHQVFVFSKD